MKNVQIVVNYKLLKKNIVSTCFLCFFVFVCLFVVAFFFSTLVMDIQQVWKKFVDFTGISRTPRKKQKPLARCRIFDWQSKQFNENSIKIQWKRQKKHFSFNGESTVIPFLCFLGGFALGRRIRGDMSMLRFLPFFTTNTDNSVFFGTSSFHLQRQKTV